MKRQMMNIYILFFFCTQNTPKSLILQLTTERNENSKIDGGKSYFKNNGLHYNTHPLWNQLVKINFLLHEIRIYINIKRYETGTESLKLCTHRKRCFYII